MNAFVHVSNPGFRIHWIHRTSWLPGAFRGLSTKPNSLSRFKWQHVPSWWLTHPFQKYPRQIGSSPKVQVKIKEIFESRTRITSCWMDMLWNFNICCLILSSGSQHCQKTRVTIFTSGFTTFARFRRCANVWRRVPASKKTQEQHGDVDDVQWFC